MDWLDNAVKFGSGLVLGSLSGLVWPRLLNKIAERKDRKAKAELKGRILKDLDLLASDVMAAVQVQPHGVQNKDEWASRLRRFAKQYDQVLGPLAGYVKRISYKIEDSTFDHERLGNPPYCCDQVEEDLAFLKLCILPIVAHELGWDSEAIEKEETRLLEKIWVDFQEVFLGLPPPGARADMTEEELTRILAGYDAKKTAEEHKTKQVKQWHAEWKAYEFKIGESENLAMAPYVNHERKRATEK